MHNNMHVAVIHFFFLLFSLFLIPSRLRRVFTSNGQLRALICHWAAAASPTPASASRGIKAAPATPHASSAERAHHYLHHLLHWIGPASTPSVGLIFALWHDGKLATLEQGAIFLECILGRLNALKLDVGETFYVVSE